MYVTHFPSLAQIGWVLSFIASVSETGSKILYSQDANYSESRVGGCPTRYPLITPLGSTVSYTHTQTETIRETLLDAASSPPGAGRRKGGVTVTLLPGRVSPVAETGEGGGGGGGVGAHESSRLGEKEEEGGRPPAETTECKFGGASRQTDRDRHFKNAHVGHEIKT